MKLYRDNPSNSEKKRTLTPKEIRKTSKATTSTYVPELKLAHYFPLISMS